MEVIWFWRKFWGFYFSGFILGFSLVFSFFLLLGSRVWDVGFFFRWSLGSGGRCGVEGGDLDFILKMYFRVLFYRYFYVFGKFREVCWKFLGEGYFFIFVLFRRVLGRWSVSFFFMF